MIETNEPGEFRMWIMVENELHQVRLIVPRIFYVNTREERVEHADGTSWKKCNKLLPRSRPVYNLYRYSVPERNFKCHSK